MTNTSAHTGGPRIVLFGATGFTGGFVAHALSAAGVRPLLLGRSTARLEAVAADLGGNADIALADANDPSSIADHLRKGDALISTVGPFASTGGPIAQAAAAAGAHYFDSSGEGPFVRRVRDTLGALAESNGCVLLPAFGYDYVPGTLAAALALRYVGDQAVQVDTGYFVADSTGRVSLRHTLACFSVGTIETILSLLAEETYAFRDGRLISEAPGRRVGTFDVNGSRLRGISIGAVEQLSLPSTYPHLREVNVYLGWFDQFSRALQFGSRMAKAPLVGDRGMRGVSRLGHRIAQTRPVGPSEAHRKQTRGLFIAVARDAQGQPLKTVVMRSPEPYVLTGDLLAWGAIAATQGRVKRSGAVGPIEAFGLDELQAGSAQAGLLVSQ